MIDRAQLRLVSSRHDLPVPPELRPPWTGATSHVYPCGDVVIKIALERPDAIAAVTTDAAMNPVARELGVRVPSLVAFDDARDILAVPYAVYRRVEGAIPLGDFAGGRDRTEAAWAAAGRDLARVHAVPYGAPMPVSLREFRQHPEVDPRPWVEDLLERGILDAVDAAWLRCLLDRLAPAALVDISPRLCHGDVNAANVMVDAVTGEYRALIDWAGAGWLDPVWDVAGVPLDIVPAMLAGHRSVAPLPDDASAGSRILWCQIQTRLHAALVDPRAASRLSAGIGQARVFAAATRL